MTDDAKKVLTPKLRFPEFRADSDWQNRRLDEVCSAITQGGTPDTAVPEFWKGDICWLTPAEMGKSESPFLDSTDRTITEQGLRNCSSVLLPINSVILSTRAPIGHLAINKSPMAINQGCKGLIPSEDLDFRFLYFSLAANKPRLSDLGAGNTFKELSGSALKSFTAVFPRLAEQQKIAECLSTLDERIGAESQKLDALKAHKKGLMQQLFPREGETLPRLRFPEFQDAPEWIATKLGDISEVSASGDLDAALFSETETDRHRYKVFSNAVEGEGLYGYYASSKYPANSVTITARGTLGVAFLRPRDFMGIGRLLVVSNFIHAEPAFVKECWNHLAKIPKEVTSIPQLTAIAARAIVLPLPQRSEQHRIASCLSSLDDLIAAQSDQLEALKTHKKGLMQQLFPSPTEAAA